MKKTFIVVAVLFLSSFSFAQTQMANPASVKCIEDGYKLEIRKDKDGGEYGICIDKKKNECEEWKYFRGECKLMKVRSKTSSHKNR